MGDVSQSFLPSPDIAAGYGERSRGNTLGSRSSVQGPTDELESNMENPPTTLDPSTPAAPAVALPIRLVRGAIGGIVAGLVFIFVTMWFASSMPEGQPGNPLRLISTIVKGKSALEDGTASVGTGWVVHIVISALFGIVFALIVPIFRTNGTVALAGGLFGAALFVVDFLVIPEIWLDQFKMPNKPFELAIHIVFGHLLAVAFYSSGTRRREPFLDISN